MSAGINDYIAGAVGGAAGLIVGHPFDTTKVQMQTAQTSRPYSGVLEAAKNIRAHGMTHGFYRGLGFPLASYGVVNSVFFGVYSSVGQWMRDRTGRVTQTQTALAAAAGGACQLLVACPVDVIKVVLQSQISREPGAARNGRYFRGPTDCLSHMFKTGGLGLCYKGLGIMFLRDIPASVLYFLIYENMKSVMTKNGWSDSRGIFADIMGGGMAGCLSWAVIMPFDVVKTEIQADFNGKKYSGISDCVKKIYKARGMKAFTTGFLPCMIRAFPANAAIFVFYTQSLSALQYIQR